MTSITLPRATAQQALEALKFSTPNPRSIDDDYAEQGWKEHIAALAALRAALAQPVPHGCHVYPHLGMKPDGCVLDDGRPENCIYAKRLLREGKDKTACVYWQPIEVTR